MIKLFIYILPIFVSAQTWVFNHDYKIPPNLTVTVDTLIGNGHKLYFTCRTGLSVRSYIENVQLVVLDSTSECNSSNYVKLRHRKYPKVKIGSCLNVVTPRPKRINLIKNHKK